MLTAGDALVNDLGDAVARDPEVRQARMIAEAARKRLVACVSRAEDGIDLTEAQGMLDALRNAWTLAGDAEDRVLLYRGLLTQPEADKRAAQRHPAAAPPDCVPDGKKRHRIGHATRAGADLGVRSVVIALVLALLGVVGAILAHRGGSGLPLAARRS